MDKYDIEAIIGNASTALERINGTQPAQEVMGYALTSIASSLLALAITEAEVEPRGKHGLKADSQSGSEE